MRKVQVRGRPSFHCRLGRLVDSLMLEKMGGRTRLPGSCQVADGLHDLFHTVPLLMEVWRPWSVHCKVAGEATIPQ